MAHALVKSLPEDRLNKLRKMLVRGDSMKFICKVIQEDWELLTDVGRDTLRRALDRYNRDEVQQVRAKELVDNGLVGRIEQLSHRTDVMEELERLIAIQSERLEKALAVEKPTKGILHDQVSRAMRELVGLLDRLGRLHLETGIIRRAPKTIEAEYTDPHGETHGYRITEAQETRLERLQADAAILEEKLKAHYGSALRLTGPTQ